VNVIAVQVKNWKKKHYKKNHDDIWEVTNGFDDEFMKV